ncbi:COMD8 protein, partial [Eolophus roseicapillus]|nr:COMD8 protein [Eolophus roseicapilla]
MLQLLEKLPPGRALEFLHKIVDGICGRAYPRYQDYGNIWSLLEWMEVLEETGTYFKTAVGKNISDEEVRAHNWYQKNVFMVTHQDLPEICINCKSKILPPFFQSHNTNFFPKRKLSIIQEHLKLALSSDKISMLQMPLLNLDLDVRENGEIKPVSIEMNKEELQNLINSLEAANKVVFTDT